MRSGYPAAWMSTVLLLCNPGLHYHERKRAKKERLTRGDIASVAEMGCLDLMLAWFPFLGGRSRFGRRRTSRFCANEALKRSCNPPLSVRGRRGRLGTMVGWQGPRTFFLFFLEQ